MAAFADALENGLLLLLFNATTLANIADDASSGALTVLEVSLHTSSAGDAGNQTTNETAYTSYEREAVDRDGTGWTVTTNSVSPAANIEFTQCSGSTSTVTHFGIGKAHTSTGTLLIHGSVSPSISVATGVTPILTTATAITLD